MKAAFAKASAISFSTIPQRPGTQGTLILLMWDGIKDSKVEHSESSDLLFNAIVTDNKPKRKKTAGNEDSTLGNARSMDMNSAS